MYELKINGEVKSAFGRKETAIKNAEWYSERGFDAVVVDTVNHMAVYVCVA